MYEVIYADPAWRYNDKKPRGGAEKHYPTMSLEEIKALPVSSVASPNAVLFLWATWPLIFSARDVIEAWGFEYKNCAFLWAKTTKLGKWFFGLGHWTRGNTEPCLLAVRGDIRRIDAGVPQLITAPFTKHSAKPPEVRDRIVRLMGDRPRVELFARQRVPGWDAWGNEIESTVSL